MKINFKSNLFKAFALTLSLSIALTACDSKADNSKNTAAGKQQNVATEKKETKASNDEIKILSTKVSDESVVVEGKTTINPEVSTYIQYYVGKEYKNTLSTCILSDGFDADKEGNFKLEIPVSTLKGSGNYKLVLEQNPKANKILPPQHWQAITKTEEGVAFGDITSMGEISNLALTVGMKIVGTEFKIDGEAVENNAIKIENVNVTDENVIIAGTTSIDPKKSTYIQYYVGKNFEGTLSQCILCDGFNVNEDGTFKAEIPVNRLKGNGQYTVVLEQNPNANKILPPKHWQAITKTEEGIAFGDITSMGEISNLAVTVGMQAAASEFVVGNAEQKEAALSITDSKVEDGKVVIKGKTTINPEKSTYIQYYIGKEIEGTLSNCILCDGINADKEGNFEFTLPVDKLKGVGKYSIVFEQNPNADKIIAPNRWKAFYKEEDQIKFGDISAMKELSNLALTVGMEIVETEIEITE